jgi:hypothetical protein
MLFVVGVCARTPPPVTTARRRMAFMLGNDTEATDGLEGELVGGSGHGMRCREGWRLFTI